MSDWSLIESTLKEWVADITGLPCYWKNRPTGYRFQSKGMCLLSISGHKTLGLDNLTFEYDSTSPAEQEITYAQSGQRQFTFGIQVRTQRQSVDYDAKNYTSLIRDSVSLPIRSSAIFKSAGISYARILGDVQIETDLDGREMSVSQLDLLMNSSALVEDSPTTYISQVQSAELEAPEGTPRWTGNLPTE